MKACFRCKTFKPHSEFYASPGTRDGVSGKCKECAKADVRANYREHLEQYKEYERGRAMAPHRVAAREAYAKTPAGIDAFMRSSHKYNKTKACREAKRRHRERYPVKRSAQIAAGNAIRDGRLIRQPCEVCSAEKTQAHHDDYGKPLDVRWLCTTHHAEWHKHNTPLCPPQEQAA